MVNGIGTAIESSYFTTLGGGYFFTLASLVASFPCAFVITKLFPAPSAERAPCAASIFARWTPVASAARFVLALLAFPFFYFLFGLMTAPIVVPVYEQLDWAFVPSMSTLLSVFFPPILRWTHGPEILATSVCYGIALAWLLFAPPAQREAERAIVRDGPARP